MRIFISIVVGLLVICCISYVIYKAIFDSKEKWDIWSGYKIRAYNLVRDPNNTMDSVKALHNEIVKYYTNNQTRNKFINDEIRSSLAELEGAYIMIKRFTSEPLAIQNKE